MSYPLNIKTRLTLWYLLYLFIVIVFFCGLSYLILNQNVYHTNNNALSTTSIMVKNTTSTSNATSSDSNQPDFPDQSYHFLLAYNINVDQLMKIQSEAAAPLSLHIGQETLTIDQKAFITSDITDALEVWLSYRSSTSQPGYYEILIITQPKTEIMSLIGVYKEILFIAIPTTLVLAAILGYFLVKRMLKPVENITMIAQEIQDKDLTRRIEIKTNDELGKLSATLNQAFGHLQKSFERERQFTNDASHELQTPLAVIQGQATLALTQERSNQEYQKTLESISQEITHMHSVVSKLLRLARADNDTEHLLMTKLNLKDILDDIAEDIQILCEKKKLQFQTDIEDSLIVLGDEVRLKELFMNLLDNAIKYTPAGGNITLSLAKQDKTAKVSIQDTGIGISAEHLPHIFERFYRVNKTHSGDDEGSGLGLAICMHIVELHDGRIEVESKIGEGSIFKVILPSAEG